MEVKRDGRLAGSLVHGAGSTRFGDVQSLPRLPGERIRCYSAGVAEAAGGLPTGAAVAAGFGAGLGGFGAG